MKIKVTKVNQYSNNSNNSLGLSETYSPFGIGFIDYALNKGDYQLDKQKVLEVGCGVGDHLRYLAPNIDKMIGIDDNKIQLNIAKDALKTSKIKNVKLKQGSFTNLPVKKNNVHSIFSVQNMVNLTLKNSVDILAELSKTVKESYRVLKKEGILILTTSSHYQLKYCFWWSHFLPESLNKILNIIPSLKHILEELISSNFRILGVYEYPEELYSEKDYYDPFGPLKSEIKDKNHLLSFATEDEYIKAMNEIKIANEDNSIYEIINSYDSNIKKAGQSTFIIAQKF